jgi:RNA recognition motif-containing protein
VPSLHKRKEDTLQENKKILVGNLPIVVQEEQLAELFMKSPGRVVSISIPKNVYDHNCGYAFVEMASYEEAIEAVKALAGSEINGRLINISMAEQSQDKKEKKKWYNFNQK